MLCGTSIVVLLWSALQLLPAACQLRLCYGCQSVAAAGVCYRLWSSQEHEQLLPCTPPEIVSADLAPLALQLAAWGSPDGQGLAWLDEPDPAALADARQLLVDLAAVDAKGALTATGV